MRKFNINDYMYIQITETGWKYLERTVGIDYIKNCIEPNRINIDGETWYMLQVHNVFEFLPVRFGEPLKFNPDVMFNDRDLKLKK